MSFPNRSSCSLSGVLTLSSICAATKTLPFSVLSPTAKTRITPFPSMTFVPRMAWLEGKVASESCSSATTLFLQIGSPVKVDSSICNCTASSSSPSAGISLPVVSITISPTTMSRLGTICVWPSRITCTGSSSLT